MRSTLALVVVGLISANLFALDYGLKEGKTDIQSAGPITFGPDGILFVGDTVSAHVYAFATNDEASEPHELSMSNVADKIGKATKQTDVKVNDMAVHPGSGAVYLSCSSSSGPSVVRISGSEIKAVDIGSSKHAKIELTNVPAPGGEGRRNKRAQCITDLAFLDGSLLCAGLSNDREASKMRSISFPFAKTDSGSSIKIYHGAHGAEETRSAAQTFVPLNIGGEPSVVAAYICTPLVTYPISAVTSGDEIVEATTVAELGNRNKPLDMLSYEKDGNQYLLLSNSARGVMKIDAKNVGKIDAIKDRVEGGGSAGLEYDTIENLKGVVQLDRLDETRVLAMIDADGMLEIETFELP